MADQPTRLADRIPVALRQKNFRYFWSAQTISYVGDQVTTVALPLIAVLALDASAADMGLLMTLHSLPMLLFSMHVGVWVDRRGRRRKTMIVMDLIRAVVIASLPAAYFVGSLTLWHLYAAAFVIGSLAVVFNVAAPTLFTAMLPREQYLSGTALSRGSFSFSFVAGPSIGGVIIQVLSAPAALLIDAVSFLFSASLLGKVQVEEPEGTGKREKQHLREALAFIRRSPVLTAKFASGVVLNFFYTIYFTLLFLYAAKNLGLSAALIGMVVSVGAVGALLGSAITTRLSGRLGMGTTFIAGALLFSGALVLTPLASGEKWLVVTMLVVGEFISALGLMLVDITGSTIQQAITPDRLRARMQGALMAITYGVRPLGSLVAGGLGTWLGLRETLWLAVVGGFVGVLFLFFSPVRGMRDLPDESE